MEEQEKKTKSMIKEAISFLLYCVIVVVLALGIRKYVVHVSVVDGSSMESTLEDNDHLLLDKISYRFTDPQRFDVVVFQYQHTEDTYYIKRVIGLPGETVFIDDDGTIYIDGEILEESYGKEVIADPGIAREEVTLGEDEYFVLGDNRNNSRDSRFEDVGNVKKDTMVGKAVLRIYPFDKMGVVSHINTNEQ